MTHSEVFALETEVDLEDIMRHDVSELDLPDLLYELWEGVHPEGVGLLTYDDSLAVEYIEQLAYADNPGLISQPYRMQTEIIAMQINNAQKGRSNLSVQYRNPAGTFKGFLLAYEGKIDGSGYQAYDPYQGRECVFVADVSSDRSDTLAGGKLLVGFMQRYVQEYLNKGVLMPILGEFRDVTSYQILQKHFNRVSEKMGVTFELVEIMDETVGENTMHHILLQPTQIKTAP